MGQRSLFGTDGVRGTANTYPMTAEIAMQIGMAAGKQFMRGDHRHTVVIGKDTRLSGYLLEPALVAGFVAVGVDVILLGPLPTPAIAMLARSMRADLGVMISASHNPYEDNGIKLFGPDGYKLSDEVEAEIESRIENDLEHCRVAPDKLGSVRRMDDASGRYIEYVKSTFPRGLRLDGLKVVVDCANGAGYRVAPTVLWELGATVVPVGVEPDGRNINKNCGATSTDVLREQVVRHGADIGVALDGDADRLIVVDETGRVIDGDQLIALIATRWKKEGILSGDGVVTTVMSNMGLEQYLESQKLSLIRTQVGDRYVVDKMRADNYNLGGEQSGHLVLGEHSTTGDGLLAALQVCAAVVEAKKPASQVTRLFDTFPQILRNVRFKNRQEANRIMQSPVVTEALAEAEKALKGKGRVLTRPSGTEPLIRVMVEGKDEAQITTILDGLIDVIEQADA